MELRAPDWQRLAQMRAQFLERVSDASAEPFAWRDTRDLELYEAGFAQRIAWKWRAVLDELAEVSDFVPGGSILDWGCGTGVASREFLGRFGADAHADVHLWDRSALAREFARERMRESHPGVSVHAGPPDDRSARILLASHVLNELDLEGERELLALAARSEWFVWVEAADHATSRRLSAARERLLERFDVRAPCTHRAACGVLAPGLERHWCHHFARPPAEAHQSATWARFKKELGIDLSRLPFSYLVLQRKPDAVDDPAGARRDQASIGLSRVLGRPRITKGRAQIDNCDADGVHTRNFLQRDDPALFKRLRDPDGERLVFRWSLEKDRVRPAAEPPSAS